MKQRILIFFICIVQLSPLFSESMDRFFSQYNFRFISETAGLPYSFVSDIFKDSEGYVWVATHNGISRYDGYQFLNYGTQTNPVCLKNNFIHKVCEDNLCFGGVACSIRQSATKVDEWKHKHDL